MAVPQCGVAETQALSYRGASWICGWSKVVFTEAGSSLKPAVRDESAQAVYTHSVERR